MLRLSEVTLVEIQGEFMIADARSHHRSEPTVIFKILADPTRRALFERLTRDGELTVHALTGPSGISQPAVSRHLSALKVAGLVRDRRYGRETYYSAEPIGLTPMFDWMSVFGSPGCGYWVERFK